MLSYTDPGGRALARPGEGVTSGDIRKHNGVALAMDGQPASGLALSPHELSVHCNVSVGTQERYRNTPDRASWCLHSEHERSVSFAARPANRDRSLGRGYIALRPTQVHWLRFDRPLVEAVGDRANAQYIHGQSRNRGAPWMCPTDRVAIHEARARSRDLGSTLDRHFLP